MTIDLLPRDFDERVTLAVASFWRARGTGARNGREAVVGGSNMDGFIDLARAVAVHCGLPPAAVHMGKKQVTLPGFFRATKDWDVLVVDGDRLLAAFEFKSQVGSFGNNLNNRAEEVVGAAADLWIAHHHGAYGGGQRSRDGIREEQPAALNPTFQADPRPPFVAWLMLLEECEAALIPVKCAEPHFKVFGEFRGASYARRYQILCERLVERQLYSATCLLLSPTGQATYRSLSSATSIRALFADFAGRLLAARES